VHVSAKQKVVLETRLVAQVVARISAGLCKNSLARRGGAV